ncbi:MAG TPA: sn-glycerol-3-phosphate ABC transporter ATP-binding protein UgpC [Beijerinckiaceae bacterium]|nr:sn-glycerol-3-phosphate ABC transporter ATP-binding protein UgpC [Beijerinckiaceae bacterium]
MATLDLRQVTKSFGATKVIHGVDLSIGHGEFIVFVGPSGCGKSTLLRLIAGLESVTGGAIEIDGALVNDVPAAERGLAMVFQSYALYPHMSVRQNLSFGLENLKTPKPEIQRRVAEAARMLRMEHLLDRRPGQLSGGQRQRVAIGRAVVREPKIFLFDEPLSNLDAELRVQMRIEIGNLHQRLGNTMIYVTHDQVEAMTMADRIAVLKDGRLEQFGRPLDLYNRPANLFVAGFIGSPRMNFLDGTVAEIGSDGVSIALKAGGTLKVPCSAGPSASASAVRLGVRPEHIALVENGTGDVPLSVSITEQLGGESYLHGALPSGETLSVRIPGQTRVKRGETVGLTLAPPEHRHLFDATTGLVLPPLS